MLCHAILCYARLRYIMLRHSLVLPQPRRNVMLCCGILFKYDVLRWELREGASCHKDLVAQNAMLCYARLRYAMLSYGIQWSCCTMFLAWLIAFARRFICLFCVLDWTLLAAFLLLLLLLLSLSLFKLPMLVLCGVARCTAACQRKVWTALNLMLPPVMAPSTFAKCQWGQPASTWDSPMPLAHLQRLRHPKGSGNTFEWSARQ